MTALFIANTTKQRHEFNFRLPESPRVQMRPIEPGTQVKLLPDATKDEIDYVLQQHAKYGLVSQEEAAKTKGRYIGFIYSLDKPVQVKNMDLVYKHNDDELRKLGKKNLERQGIAINENLQKITQEATGRGAVERTAVEVVEQQKPGGRDPEVAEGVEVLADGVEPSKGQRRKGRG